MVIIWRFTPSVYNLYYIITLKVHHRLVAADVAEAEAEGLLGTGDGAVPVFVGLGSVEPDEPELVDQDLRVGMPCTGLAGAIDRNGLDHLKPCLGDLDLLELLAGLLIQEATLVEFGDFAADAIRIELLYRDEILVDQIVLVVADGVFNSVVDHNITQHGFEVTQFDLDQ